MKKQCWIRQIQVILTSNKINKKLIFDNFDPKHQFNITISGTKKVSLNQDMGVVQITNLSYSTICEITAFEFYGIEIKAGYKDNNLDTYFKGEVSFISQKIHSRHDTITYITFASTLVAKYSQKRINFNWNSGINKYAALNTLCNNLGIGNRVRIDASLANIIETQSKSGSGTIMEIAEEITGNYNEYMLTSDSSGDNSWLNVLNLKNTRRINLDPNSIQIAKGNPVLTSDGLRLSVLPTFNFKPGDIIHIDNSLIDVSISSPESVTSTFSSNFFDVNGDYVILQIDFAFQNLGSQFELNIKARALSIMLGQQES